MTRTLVSDYADRYLHGVGPLPSTWQTPRDPGHFPAARIGRCPRCHALFPWCRCEKASTS